MAMIAEEIFQKQAEKLVKGLVDPRLTIGMRLNMMRITLENVYHRGYRDGVEKAVEKRKEIDENMGDSPVEKRD